MVGSELKLQASLKISEELTTLDLYSQKGIDAWKLDNRRPLQAGHGISSSPQSIPPTSLISISCLELKALWFLTSMLVCACAGGRHGLMDICYESLETQECFKRWRRALATPMEELLGKQNVWGCKVSEYYLQVMLV